MKAKKAFVMSDAMIWLILGLIALAVISYVVFPYIFKTGKETGKRFALTQDCDQDGIENFLDKCPCKKGNYEAKNSGCSGEEDPTPCTEAEMKACQQE